MKTWNVIKWVLMACGLAATAQAQLSIMPVNPNKQLDSWGFNDATWTSDLGYVPVSIDNLNNPPGFDGNALQVDYSMGPAWLNYNVVEVDGTTNLTFNNGTVELWFLPDWNSGTGPGDWGRLIDVGQCTTNASAGWWSLYFSPDGNWLYFTCQTNGTSTNYLSCPIAWDTNTWHFVALTYNHLRTLLYIDGQLATSGPGISLQPPASARAGGFYVGSDLTGTQQARGVMDDLVTYNYAIASEQVTNDFQSGQQIVSPVAGAIRMADSTGGGINPGGGGLNGGGGGGAFQYNFPVINTNLLWLNVTNVSGGLAYLNLFNATNQVYAIWSTTDLLSNWQVETEVWPTDTNCMSFTVLTSGRANLFMQAEDWTGVTENGNATPDWWFWMYFGTTELSDTNLDSNNNYLLNDFQNGQDPNIIQFSLAFNHQYINTPTGTVQLNISAGVPCFCAVLVNDTNMADAVWLPYPGTNVTVATPTDGVYQVSIGLRGLPASGTQTWQDLTFIRDTNPPILLITNLAVLSGSRPFIDTAGYSTKALHQITCTLVDANGITNDCQAFVIEQGLNPWAPYYVTNWFQCLDLALAQGTNLVSIQAVDWAGNVAITNFAYVFDTNGDTTPPAITLIWPQNGTHISGSTYTVQGALDDDTATVTLQYMDTNGNIQIQNGLVERGGNLWVENVPVQPGTNTVCIIAVDAAGNRSTNNITVVQSDLSMTVTPLSNDAMNSAYATVFGTVGDPDCAILVNGIQGTNYGDGTWEVDNVPLGPGGTVSLLATAQPANDFPSQTLMESDRLPSVYTETYSGSLNYNMLDITASEYGGVTNGSETHQISLAWSRGKGGALTNSSTQIDYANGDLSIILDVITWPADTGYFPSLPGQRIVNNYNSNAFGIYISSNTNLIGPPSVEWMEQSMSSASEPNNFNVSETESSARQIKLFTGGKALRKSQGLFQLSTKLNQELGIDPNVPDWSGLYVGELLAGDEKTWHFLATGAAVPSTETALATFGNLGADGNVWKMLPDGQSPVISASAPVKSFVGALPDKQVFVLTHTTKYPALTDTNLARLNLGVGEYVYFGGMPDATIWKTSAGSLDSTVGCGVNFTAPSNAANATVTATCHGIPWLTTFQVFEPKGVDHADVAKAYSYPPETAGVGMLLYPYMAPTYVSFYRVQCEEVGENATAVTGYFTNNPPFTVEFLSHRGKSALDGHGKGDDWFDIQNNNQWQQGWDSAYITVDFSPWSDGGFSWNIPWKWKIGSGPKHKVTSGWQQVFTIDSSGTMTVKKFNHIATRSVDEFTGTVN